MEGEGFEPSKAEPSDLQSDPFDRSGTPPKSTTLSFTAQRMSIAFHYDNSDLATLLNRILIKMQKIPWLLILDGAGTRNRTRDLLITSQLLYRLSYASLNYFTHITKKGAQKERPNYYIIKTWR